MRLLLSAILAMAPALALAQSASVPAPDLKPGDTWVIDRTIEKGTSGFSDTHLLVRVERVGADTMIVGVKIEGSPIDFQEHSVGSDWSTRRIVDGAQSTAARPFAFPMAVGKTWTSDFVDPTRYGLQTSAEHHQTYKVTGWEDVTTPAGTFHTLKVEEDDKVKAQFAAATGAIGGALTTADGSTIIAHADRSGPRVVYGETFTTLYYSPEAKYWVKYVEESFNSENIRTERKSDMVISFKPAP